MAMLKYRDPTTLAWVALPNIAGPAGPPGPVGPTGPVGAGGLDQATANTLYVNVAGDTMNGSLRISGDGHSISFIGTSQQLIYWSEADRGLYVSGTELAIIEATTAVLKPLQIGAPTAANHATTKQYTDGKILHGTAAPTGVYPAGTIYAQYT